MEDTSFLPPVQPIWKSQNEIQFTGLSYRVKQGRSKKEITILHDISGKFRSGQLTAVMGPSGAGKSTLLNVLAGFKISHVDGSVLVNEQLRNKREFRKMASYIMQDDYLLPQLTVYEYMMVSARLKLGNDISGKNKSLAVNSIMDKLGLSHCHNTRITDLSGGERKRVCIALELVDNPQILFLDEPTSGLDSSSSLQCMSLLKEISREGRIVVASIHQPSSRLLELFDQLYVVAGGYCIYQGLVRNLVPFLHSADLNCPSYHNPGDFIIDVASGDYGNVIETLVQKTGNGRLEFKPELDVDSAATTDKDSILAKTSVDTKLGKRSGSAENNFPVPFCTQFAVLLHRAFISIWREKILTLVRFVAHVLVGIIIGLLYWRIGNDASKVFSNAGLLFFNQLFLLFTAIMPTLLTFPLERDVLRREHMNHWYSLKAYFLAKTTADIPFQMIFPLIYIVIVYFMTDQPCELHRFLMLLTISILVSLVAQGFALLVGAATSIQVAAFLGPVLHIPFLLFSGFLITLKTIPSYMQWMSYLSFIRYSFEGFLLSTYGYDRSPLLCSEAYCHFKLPVKFLEQMEMQDGVFVIDCICLLAFFVLVRIAGYFLLKFKLRFDH